VAELGTVVGLLVAVGFLGALAARMGVPYPPVLVLGGLVFGLIPGAPDPSLKPSIVLFLFLPPLIYAASFRVAALPLRGSVVHVVVLSVGLVVATLVAVAVVAHAVAGIPWVAAFALGALAGATDPISASAIVRRVGAHERLVAILEGESLLNDGTGLAAFQVAVAAAAVPFSVGGGVVRFLAISVGGLAIGLAVGVVAAVVRRGVQTAWVEVVLGLVTAFAAYLLAHVAGCSGVLGAVAAGLWVGRAEWVGAAELHLRVEPVWGGLTFVLDSLLFLLIGLELPHVVDALHGHDAAALVGEGITVTLTAMAVRGLWMATVTRGISRLGKRLAPAHVEVLTGWELTVLGWSGMRGALALAGALSIPLAVHGHPFPGRNQVVFLVYCVVLGTLVLPSFTLEPLVRRAGDVPGDVPSGPGYPHVGSGRG
jgi:Na+/H+ antiporter